MRIRLCLVYFGCILLGGKATKSNQQSFKIVDYSIEHDSRGRPMLLNVTISTDYFKTSQKVVW